MILSLLFPPKCVLCGKILKGPETDLCHTCRVEAAWCPVSKRKRSFLDSWVAIWYYEGYSRLNKLLNKDGVAVINTEFDNSVTVSFAVKKEIKEQFKDKLIDAFNGKLEIQEVAEEFYPF